MTDFGEADDDWALVDDEDIAEHKALEGSGIEAGEDGQLMGSWHLDDDYIHCGSESSAPASPAGVGPPVVSPASSPPSPTIDKAAALQAAKAAAAEQARQAEARAKQDALEAQIAALQVKLATQEQKAAAAAEASAATKERLKEKDENEQAAYVQLELVHRENRELKQKARELEEAAGAEVECEDESSLTTIDSSAHIWGCKQCDTHLGTEEDIISKDFTGSTGRAYLISNCVNARLGPTHECVFKTGVHAVADIFCEHCGATLGWKYLKTSHKSQAYKEGKYILEEALISRNPQWGL